MSLDAVLIVVQKSRLVEERSQKVPRFVLGTSVAQW